VKSITLLSNRSYGTPLQQKQSVCFGDSTRKATRKCLYWNKKFSSIQLINNIIGSKKNKVLGNHKTRILGNHTIEKMVGMI